MKQDKKIDYIIYFRVFIPLICPAMLVWFGIKLDQSYFNATLIVSIMYVAICFFGFLMLNYLENGNCSEFVKK